jgi:hypothetical protein
MKSYSKSDDYFSQIQRIDEIFELYKRSKEYMSEKVIGLRDQNQKERFLDEIILQMFILWFLQEKMLFNNDKAFFVTQFSKISENNFPYNYYKFLASFIRQIQSKKNELLFKTSFGRLLNVKPAIIIDWSLWRNEILIPDECFYQKEFTSPQESYRLKGFKGNIPLLNVLECQNWTNGINEYVIGSLYEKIISKSEKKVSGAYYTPEFVSSFICKQTIDYLFVKQFNNKYNTNVHNFDEIITHLDQNQFDFVFKKLQEIKILDPAVGSAHFLESAVNYLILLYEKLQKKANELNYANGLTIHILNDNGELKEINLGEISNSDELRLYLKFFIIFPKNIYGIDINQKALKIARARLFLSLINHYTTQDKKKCILSNMQVNLKVGNSLVGYLKHHDKKKISLNKFLVERHTTVMNHSIKISDELRSFLETSERILNLNGNFIKDFKTFERIFNHHNLTAKEIAFVLKLKKKLIVLLNYSLNTKFTSNLKGIINSITSLLNKNMNNKFLEEFNIDFHEIKSLNPFHWFLEFPEVFVNSQGMDIIIGNPPYLSNKDVPKKDKIIFTKLSKNKKYKKHDINIYSLSKGQYDLFTLFLERSYYLNKDKGFFGFIIPDAFINRSNHQNLRLFTIQKTKIEKIVRIKGVFQDPTVSNIIIINQKRNDQVNYKFDFYSYKSPKEFLDKIERLVCQISTSYIVNIPFFPIICLNKTEIKIINHLLDNNRLVNFIEIGRGEEYGKNVISQSKKSKKDLEIIGGEDVQRYYLKSIGFIEHNKVKKKDELYKSPKIILRQLGDCINATLDENKNLITLQSVYNIKAKQNSELLKLILVLLNSTLIKWFDKKVFRGKDLFSRILIENIKQIPIKIPKNHEIINNLVDTIVILKEIEIARIEYNKYISYLDNLLDYMIYEIFFSEQLTGDQNSQTIKKLLEKYSTRLNEKNKNYQNLNELIILIQIIEKDLIIEKKIKEMNNQLWIKIIQEKNNHLN